MSASARLDMHLQPSLKQDAERAAALIGVRSLTEFVMQLHDTMTRVLRETTSSLCPAGQGAT